MSICNTRSSLIEFGVNDNFFSGSFPSCFWTMPNLAILSISHNWFTGTIAADLSEMTSLTELLIFSNDFGGPLPRTIRDGMLYWTVDENSFTGTIPEALLERLNVVEIAYFDYNYLTGTIPDSIGELVLVNSLNLQNNILSGTLPDMTDLFLLNFVFVSNNVLSGSVTGVLDSRKQRLVTNIDFSNNQFTGSLPFDVFNISTLLTFAAVSNCFTGTISNEICKATELTALAIDGLHTASSCRRALLPRVSDSYGLKYYWTGGIPECIYNLSHINTLHVSGNGIGGSLTNNLTLSGGLSDLSLSYNQFTGVFPKAIGDRAFESVDLSFNRLGGIISASPYQLEDSTVYYQVNRLSGNIPTVLRNVETISVLNGNHFLCRLDRNQLPKHDKQYSYYECGTSSLEKSIFVWIGLFSMAMLITVYMWCNATRKRALIVVRKKVLVALDNVRTWMNIYSSHDSNPLNVQLFGQFMRDLRLCTAMLTLYVVLILVPVNVVLSHYYDTYQYPYAWSVGSVYLSGYTAAVVLCVLFSLFLLCMMGVFALFLTTPDLRSTTMDLFKSRNAKTRSFGLRILLCLIIIALFNFAVVLSVNVGYVLVATRYNPTIVAVTQIAVSIYKLVWNDLIVRNLVGWAHRYWSSVCGLSAAEESEWSGSYMTFNTFTMIFNVIVIPCMATAAVSSDCFYDVLIPPSHVKSSYQYKLCGSIIDSDCVEYFYQDASTSYLPPYIYRYQCSSTLVATYAILYVYNFIILSFFQPVLVVLVMWWRTKLDVNGLLFATLTSMGVIVTEANQLFDKDRFNLRMIMYLSIFVTFGVIFPPLAVMILVTVVVQTYFTQFHLGHFIAGAGVESESNRWIALQVLDESCKRVSVLFKQTVYVVCPCAAFFYAYTVYDTYADAGGGSAAVWMSCSLFLAGCVVTAMYKVWVDSSIKQSRKVESSVVRDSVIEIGSVKSSDVGLIGSPFHKA